MTKLYLLFCLLIPLFSFCQEEEVENEACLKPNKKAFKYISAAQVAGNVQDAVDNFLKAIDVEPDNAMAYYEYAMYAYEQGVKYYENQPLPTKGDRSFTTAEDFFLKVLERCDSYHAGVFYYLGIINYTQQDRESAKEYFRKFLDYKNIDNNRFPNDYTNMKRDVKEVLKQWAEDEELQKTLVPFAPFRVPNVSSAFDEYFPMISPDNELMFFTRKLDRKHLGDIVSNVVEELTYSERRDLNSQFDKGTPFKKPFNDGSFSSYGAATMSVDNKEMIICACKKENVYGQDYLNCDLYQSQFTRSGKGGNDFNWSPLQSLGSNINTVDGWEGQPSLSADGNTLYFTAMRKSTRDNDIFISKRNANGTWGMARPFDEVNTDGKDKSPFIHQDDETFYFVSTCTDKRKGAGGLDIFYVRKDDNGVWEKPVNLGIPINTPEDELGIFVSAEGSLAYFSSRSGGDWNIYGFELYVEARPESVVIMKGTLEDENGEPVKGATIEVAYGDGEVTQSFKVNGDDGRYAAVVKTGKKQDVTIAAKKEDHAFSAKLITKEEIQQQVESKEVSIRGKDLPVKKLQIGQAYEIADIQYETNSSILKASSKVMLKQFARYLKENPKVMLSILGHTDDVGDDEQNLKLSEDRARVVKNFLIENGVEKSRLNSKGLGETQPKVPNDDEYSRAINRRTEFLIEKI